MASALKIENLSKAYRLGIIGTGTLSQDIERWWAMARGKEDPFLKIGEVNDRTVSGKSDVVWSLKDINFELEQGDALGVIGRNGAGKSTLLKILSRVTSPTTGSIKAKGRIASLLEVGTGFHPELTGRENIYLNGAILGMRKKEIDKKLDEIIDFSGVERYVDTPVKRYSSGMYVRLAFAVAAHLDSETLIVDEVLAVGDAEFQKKCIGKMGEVSKGEGRTVLFVSHNIGSIRQLCNKGLFLRNGMLKEFDAIEKVISAYANDSISLDKAYDHKFEGKTIKISDVLVNGKKNSQLRVFETLTVTINLNSVRDIVRAEFFVLIYNEDMYCVSGIFERDQNKFSKLNEGDNSISLSLTASFHPGKYFLSVGAFDEDKNFIEWVQLCETFEVETYYNDGRMFPARLGSTVSQVKWH